MLNVILLGLALYLVHILLPSALRFTGPQPLRKLALENLGPRDKRSEPTALTLRAERALNNFRESLPVFLTLGLLVMIQGREESSGVLGAWVFLGARALYLPAYLSPIPGPRTFIWGAGAGGLLIMLLAVLAGSVSSAAFTMP